MTGVMSSNISSCYKVHTRQKERVIIMMFFWFRLTKSGVTQHCWNPYLLFRTMKSVRLSAE